MLLLLYYSFGIFTAFSICFTFVAIDKNSSEKHLSI